MSLNRRAAKRDSNEASIIEALRDAGYWVVQLSKKGVPDLLVGCSGFPTIVLMEVKQENQGLTKDQLQFFTDTNGCLRFVVHNAYEALQICLNWIRRGNNVSGDHHAGN